MMPGRACPRPGREAPPQGWAASRRATAVLAGGLLLVWPALLNGYPILFSDTGAFLHQTLGPLMIWDKPWIYGPLLHLFHWRLSLWPAVLAQGLVLSWLLWLAQRAVRGAVTPGAHLLLVAGLAALTAAPWFAALLMPDILAPMVVLALFLLASGTLSRRETAAVLLLATLAIAAHLSHLPLAAALVGLLAMLRPDDRKALAPEGLNRAALKIRRCGWLPAVPLAAALALLLATNLAGHGRLAVSPYGATFLLARLQADGPATRTIRAECPGAGWTLCAFANRLPMDSDEFLWAPDSPVNRDAEGRPRFLGGALLAPEARAILAETLRREPLRITRAMLANTLRQLSLTRVGDTLGREHLGSNVAVRLREGFPPAEQARYARGAQSQGRLPALVAPFLAPHAPALLLGGLAALLAGCRAALRGDRNRLALVLCVLAGVTANAFATGALSGPHHRYQARIAWLLPLAGLLGWPLRQPAPLTGAGRDPAEAGPAGMASPASEASRGRMA